MQNNNILIGVTGGIAVYKTCELVRMCVKKGMGVKVVMTENAAKLISPLVFRSLSRSTVYEDNFSFSESSAEHISLVKWADMMVIAPATANTIGKIANGIADNLLTTTVMALSDNKPLVVAPAMNVNMWNNVFTQRNVKMLNERNNCFIAGPAEGMLADGTSGHGRMLEPAQVMEVIDQLYGGIK